jgi:hypothetical protein
VEAAGEQVDRALEKAPREALGLLSQAVLLWERGQREEALERLAQAQQRERHIARARGLEYEHFWGPRALAALEAMLVRSTT